MLVLVILVISRGIYKIIISQSKIILQVIFKLLIQV